MGVRASQFRFELSHLWGLEVNRDSRGLEVNRGGHVLA